MLLFSQRPKGPSARNHPPLLIGLQSLAGGETCLNSSTLRWQNLFHTEKTVESGRPRRQRRGQRDSQNGAMGGREAKQMGALQERKAESKEREVWGACRPGEPHTARLPKSLRGKPRSLAGPREPRPRSLAPPLTSSPSPFGKTLLPLREGHRCPLRGRGVRSLSPTLPLHRAPADTPRGTQTHRY